MDKDDITKGITNHDGLVTLLMECKGSKGLKERIKEKIGKRLEEDRKRM